MDIFRKAAAAPDTWYGLLIFAAAALLGMIYFATWGGSPYFAQHSFGPAVLFAARQGLVDPSLDAVPELDAFLHPAMGADRPIEPDAFDVRLLPSDLPVHPLTTWQRQHRFLLLAAGCCWRVFGVSWSALLPLFGLFAGFAALATHALFRLVTPRIPAAACAMLLAVSPLQLDNLVRLRDFSKAPFLIGALAAMGYLMLRPYGRTRLLVTALGCGLLLGFGLGFRMDPAIATVPFCVVVLLFLDVPLRAELPAKFGALLLFAGAFAFASPSLDENVRAGNSAIYFMQGQAQIYDERLGVDSPYYQMEQRYFDCEPFNILQAYARRRGDEAFFRFETPALEQSSREFSFRYLSVFPADQIMRALAAVLRTIDELPASLSQPAPRGVTDPFLLRCYAAHAQLMHWGTRYGRYLIPLLLLIVCARRPRLAWGGLFLLLYFAGYSAMQFASRHYFYLQFLSLFALAALLSGAYGTIQRVRDGEQRRVWRLEWGTTARKALENVSLFVVCAALLISGPLALARAWQDSRAHDLFQSYAAAPAVSIPFQQIPLEDGRILIRGKGGAGRVPPGVPIDAPYFDYAFLVAEFDTARAAVPVLVQYAGAEQDLAMTWGCTLPATQGGVTRLFFPVYYSRYDTDRPMWSCFEGLALDLAAAGRLRDLRRVEAPEELPLLMMAVLPPAWETLRYHQEFTR